MSDKPLVARVGPRGAPLARRGLRGALVFAALALVLAAPAGAAEPRLRIVAPSMAQPLVGEAEVAIIAEGVDDAELASVRVILEGRTVATLDKPPWSVVIDTGEELEDKRLDVVATLRAGGTLRAGRTYRTAAGIEEIDVRLVSLSVAVSDRRGRPIEGLAREDFTVIDAGREVSIERFDAFSEHLVIALVIDTSGSMLGERLEAAKEAAAAFVRELGEKDRVLVVGFDDRVDVAAGPTPDEEAALAAIAGLEAGGGTALYDAIVRTAERLGASDPLARRAIVLLSDGRDESSSGLEPGSFHTLEEAVRKAHALDVEVYTLGIGTQLELERDFSMRLTTAEVLARIASSTGGRFVPVRRVSRLRRSFEEILEELRAQYSLAYTPAPPRPGESWRPIEVRVGREGATTRAREGYFVDER